MASSEAAARDPAGAAVLRALRVKLRRAFRLPGGDEVEGPEDGDTDDGHHEREHHGELLLPSRFAALASIPLHRNRRARYGRVPSEP
jgi:hypothetical protein